MLYNTLWPSISKFSARRSTKLMSIPFVVEPTISVLWRVSVDVDGITMSGRIKKVIPQDFVGCCPRHTGTGLWILLGLETVSA